MSAILDSYLLINIRELRLELVLRLFKLLGDLCHGDLAVRLYNVGVTEVTFGADDLDDGRWSVLGDEIQPLAYTCQNDILLTSCASI